ncbi:MAG: hypothetical protein ACKVVT_04180 [Dehalococcoidia bacterium]
MPELTHPTVTEVEPGVLAGPMRNVINPDHELGEGSIHDDATAQRVGFRGGTVAGSYHMNLFPPLALAAFGERWVERGSLSIYFRNATTDREPVRAFVKKPTGKTDEQVDAYALREDGLLVLEGSIAAGNPSEPTALQRIDLDAIDGSGLRILSEIHKGDAIPETGLMVSSDYLDQRLATAAEVLPWNLDPSIRGGRVLHTQGMENLLYRPAVESIRKRVGKAVGLFGAIELRSVNGPAFADTPYNVHGKVLAVGQSPKTEFFWYETYADDTSGRRICEMRMLLRFMKSSSPLYA